jgi:hypothetical protein
MNNLHKAGGIAALIYAASLVVGMVLGFTLLFPLMGADPEQYLAFVANNQAIIYIWNFIPYWIWSIALVVMALALYHRLKAGAPALMQTATVFAFIWAGLCIASGNLMLRDIGVVSDLYAKNPAQAVSLWTTLQAVENGITSGNEFVGSLWLLLLSLAALRTGGLNKALSVFGMLISIAGILTLIPSLTDILVMIFGLGMIVWSTWVGIFLLRRNTVQEVRQTGQVPVAI